jgi:hypothetical protein
MRRIDSSPHSNVPRDTTPFGLAYSAEAARWQDARIRAAKPDRATNDICNRDKTSHAGRSAADGSTPINHGLAPSGQ